jgi:antitoxin component HigA of HigAB toxin-antitoxin module
MNIKPIRSEADYEAALKRIHAIFGAPPGTDKGDELDVLTVLVERYEELHYPIEPPDPIEFLEYLMELRGAKQAELAKLLGSRSRASEILNRKRPLTLDQIRKISAAWQVPIEPLIREYELSA